MIRVAIIDDHPLYRHGQAMAVGRAEDFTLVADAASIEDFDRLNVPADLVLLDLPGIEGAAGVAHVCARGPKVIVVSPAGATDDVIDALAAGAAGYLTRMPRLATSGWPSVRRERPDVRLADPGFLPDQREPAAGREP